MNTKMRSALPVMIGLLISSSLLGCSEDLRSEPLSPELADLLQQHRYKDAYPELDRAVADQNQMAQFYLANYYVCGKVVHFSCARALQLFTGSSKKSNNEMSDEIVRSSKNEIAWINAACEEDGLERDIGLALKYATEASQGGNPYSVDTLAAVEARQGNYVAAVLNQKRAIELLKASAKSNMVEEYTFEEFRKRLALYEQNKPASFDKDTALQNCNALP